ncbi:hypothetical protein Trydic_g5369 [Trypoxylus dichotomus]
MVWFNIYSRSSETIPHPEARVDRQRQEREKTSPLATAKTSYHGLSLRGSEHISPVQAPQHKTRKTIPSTSVAAGTAEQGISYTTTAKITRGIPLGVILSSSLEEALVEAMRSTVRGLQFTGIHFRPGMVLVDCETEQTVNWLDQGDNLRHDGISFEKQTSPACHDALEDINLDDVRIESESKGGDTLTSQEVTELKAFVTLSDQSPSPEFIARYLKRVMVHLDIEGSNRGIVIVSAYFANDGSTPPPSEVRELVGQEELAAVSRV